MAEALVPVASPVVRSQFTWRRSREKLAVGRVWRVMRSLSVTFRTSVSSPANLAMWVPYRVLRLLSIGCRRITDNVAQATLGQEVEHVFYFLDY